jgi:hypothetical protein
VGCSHRDNVNNIRHEASRYLSNKKREYLKDETNGLAMNCKNIRHLHRRIVECKRATNRKVT